MREVSIWLSKQEAPPPVLSKIVLLIQKPYEVTFTMESLFCNALKRSFAAVLYCKKDKERLQSVEVAKKRLSKVFLV